MVVLPEAFRPMADYAQFIIWKAVPDGVKTKKLPIDPKTVATHDAHDPNIWLDHTTARQYAELFGPEFGVGFVLTVGDPFFFVDLDDCLEPSGQAWSAVATDIMGRLNGAAVEVSQSGRGLHILGQGLAPKHGCKNQPLGLEFYTEGRFVALTGDRAMGDAGFDCSAALPALIDSYFAPKATNATAAEWTDSPVDGYRGPADDDALLEKALGATTVAGVFGAASNFSALWHGDADILGTIYPDDARPFDESSADAALAQHLAFWTGNDCERIKRLMLRSGLVRGKWEREDYLPRTILHAASLQKEFYATVEGATGEAIQAKSPEQSVYAEKVRAQKMAEAPELVDQLGALEANAAFWIDNKDRPASELIAANQNTPTQSEDVATVQRVFGGQFLDADRQLEHFVGCVYVQDVDRVLTPSGAMLKPSQFNATYGGYEFQMDDGGQKTAKKAWEAFTESRVIRFPKAESVRFDPTLPPGHIIREEGRVLVNSYVPVEVERTAGDVTPFLNHLAKILPNEKDRDILLAYMAACVQHIGYKFQWAPLIQGAPGNGKTLLTRCVSYAVGKRYSHFPQAADLDNKFNGWMLNKAFIGVEDIYVAEGKREMIEALKPMITNDELEIQLKGSDQITQRVCANFMLNANAKDALRKTQDDRRFAVFYSAQQHADDILASGMGGDYFPNLYCWLRHGGYAIVAQYLTDYPIPDELNPAGKCHRAPATSSIDEVLRESLGSVEQEVLEAIDEGRPGFAGGWVSSVALDTLLQSLRKGSAVPQNKRREMMQTLGYDWHPALTKGRTNNPIGIDGGKKPRLFIKRGHISANLQGGATVAKAYQDAQAAALVVGSNPAEVFGA